METQWNSNQILVSDREAFIADEKREINRRLLYHQSPQY